MSMIGGAHERRRERRAAERAAAADQSVDVDASDMVDSAEGSATTGKVATEALDQLSTETFENAESVDKTAVANVMIVQPSNEIENETISSGASSGTGTSREDLCQEISMQKVNVRDEDIDRILKKKLCDKGVKVLDLFIQ